MFLSTILSTKLAAVIASAVVASGSLAGVGVAANAAAPGDALYGLDCAMERIGLGDGGAQERVQEAAKMVERGEVDAGLNHAALALQNQAGLDEDGQGNGALVAAANAVQNAFKTANQGESQQLQARVAEMLQWMSMNMAQGSTAVDGEFGQGVASRAHDIAGEADQVRTQSQLRTQDQTQTQTQDQTQTQTQDRTQAQDQDCDQDQTQTQTGPGYQNQNGDAYQGGQ